MQIHFDSQTLDVHTFIKLARSTHFTKSAVKKDITKEHLKISVNSRSWQVIGKHKKLARKTLSSRTASKKPLTPPKNARKIYVGCFDPNINVSDIYEVFGRTKAAYLKENVPYKWHLTEKLVIEKGLLS